MLQLGSWPSGSSTFLHPYISQTAEFQEGNSRVSEGGCKMQNAKCKMQNAKCKMQNAKEARVTWPLLARNEL